MKIAGKMYLWKPGTSESSRVIDAWISARWLPERDREREEGARSEMRERDEG